MFACPFPADVVVADVGDVVVGLGLVELGDGLVFDAEGDTDFDADAVGVLLVGGASRVGDGDDDWVGAGCVG